MTRLTILALAVGAASCSSAGNGGATSRETASASAPPREEKVLAVPRPDTIPQSEPSRLEPMPIVPSTRDSAAGGQAAIARLERAARALAHTTGCASAQQCRTAPVGAKACGGPRTYLVYCAATTDTVALARALADLERVEKAYNARAGIMSSCQFQLAPAATLAGGTCRVAGATR